MTKSVSAQLARLLTTVKHQEYPDNPYHMHMLPSVHCLTLRILTYIYGAPSKARNANVVYIWTYVWQR